MADGHRMERARWFLQSLFDPNDWRLVQGDATGVRYLPMTTDGHRRTGARERVLDVARRHPDRLKVVLNALATRVLLDEDRRAIGVEFLQGERLYRAFTPPSGQAGRAAGALCVARSRACAAARSTRRSSSCCRASVLPDALRRHGIEPLRAAAGRRREPAGSLRGQRRQPDEHEGVGGLRRRDLRRRRSAVRGLVRPPPGRVCDQRRGPARCSSDRRG